MATKKITIDGDEWLISSNEEFKDALDILGVKLIRWNGANVVGYDSIVDGEAYTLRPQRQQQVR